MNRRFTHILAAVLSALLLASCGSARRPARPAEEQYYNEAGIRIETDWSKSAYNPLTVAETAIEWSDFSASGNIAVRTSGNLKSAIQLKMVRGKSVSISIRPFLGIEVGKLYIDTDSVTVVDKYHGLYLKEAVSRFLGEGISLEALQSLLLSKPFDLKTGTLTEKNTGNFEASAAGEDGQWTLFPRNAEKNFRYFFDMDKNNIKTFNVILANGQQYALRFDGYKAFSGAVVATAVNAEIPAGGMELSFEITLNKSVKWDSGISDGINIPGNARRYSFAQILEQLAQQ